MTTKISEDYLRQLEIENRELEIAKSCISFVSVLLIR
jgi:hypothetical protein